MRVLPRRLAYGEEASLVDHLGELRARLVVVLLVLAVTTGVAFGFHHHILDALNGPLPTRGGKQVKPITIDVSEPFLTSFWISLWTGVAAAFPVIVWQIWGFFAPALTTGTQRKITGFSLFAGLLLIGGVVFGYFVVLKPAIHFLTNYDSTQFDIQIRAKSYYSFVLAVLAAMGIVFELPIFVLALNRIGILSTQKLRKNRRWGYVIVATVAVALPGIDPVTTTLEMIPLWFLFEGSIWLCVLFDKRRRARATATDTDYAADEA